MDNYDVNVCMINKGGVIGSESKDNSGDMSFNYDTVFDKTFENCDDNNDFIEEERGNLLELDHGPRGTNKIWKHKGGINDT